MDLIIPKGILLDKVLTVTEKVILAWIVSCGEIGCETSNQEFSEMLNIGITTVSRTIKHLTDLGYIEQVSFDGRIRVLKPVYSKWN